MTADGNQPPGLRRLSPPGGTARPEREEPPSPAPQAATGPKERAERSSSDIILAGIGCVLILAAGLVIVGIFALRMVRHADPTPPPATAVAAIAATPTARPTSTPTPTTVPKPTPLPTWTPLPDRGGSQRGSTDYRGHDAEYRADIQQMGEFLKASLTEVNGLLQNPQPDDSMWGYKVGTQIGTWQGIYSTAQEIQPPNRYAQFHLSFLKALARLDSAASDLIKAVDYDDAAAMASAKTAMEQGSKLLNDALTSLKSSAAVEPGTAGHDNGAAV